MYALGRGLEHYDAPTVRKIVRKAAGEDYRWSSIILGIVNSTPFQMRRSGLMIVNPEAHSPAHRAARHRRIARAAVP